MSNNSVNNDDFDFQRAATRAAEIEKILKDYDEQGGSSTFSLKAIRDCFAQVHSYNEPDFIKHFSVVARRAIDLDREKNRPIAEIGGRPPSRPSSPNAPIFVLPVRANVPIGSNRAAGEDGLRLPFIADATQNPKRASHTFGFPSLFSTSASRRENTLPPLRFFGMLQNTQFQNKGKGILRNQHPESSSPDSDVPTQRHTTTQASLSKFFKGKNSNKK